MQDLYIITGATGGMGLDLSRHLHGKGHLLLLDISLDKLNKLKNELQDNVDVMKFDITLNDDIEKVYSFVKSYGGFKYLINFAGVSESMKDSFLIYKINLLGQKKLIDKLSDLIVPGGVIVNTASIAGHMTPPKEGLVELFNDFNSETLLDDLLKLTKNNSEAYGFSKLGVIYLTKQYAKTLGEKGIRVVSISPGVIHTPMIDIEMDKNSDSINQLISLTPVKRVGLPSDITNLVDFLLSDNASFISGVDFIIDGGLTSVVSTL